MEGVGLAFLALIVLVVIGFSLYRQRQRAANVDLEDKSWLRVRPLRLSRRSARPRSGISMSVAMRRVCLSMSRCRMWRTRC